MLNISFDETGVSTLA